MPGKDVPVVRSSVVMRHHTLKMARTTADLGGDFFDCEEPERLTRHYVKRLDEHLGHRIPLERSVV